MKTFLIIIAIVGIVFAVIQNLKEPNKEGSRTKREKPDEDLGKYFFLKKNLFTSSEYTFYQELQKQNNGQFVINSKVRLEDIVGVAKGVGDRFREMRSRIKSRHIDFVIVGHGGEILSAIELDGSSHDYEKAKAGDEIKNQIFAFNNVRFYRVRVGENYAERIQAILADTKGA